MRKGVSPIYEITDKSGLVVYVGISCDPESRFKSHKRYHQGNAHFDPFHHLKATFVDIDDALRMNICGYGDERDEMELATALLRGGHPILNSYLSGVSGWKGKYREGQWLWSRECWSMGQRILVHGSAESMSWISTRQIITWFADGHVDALIAESPNGHSNEAFLNKEICPGFSHRILRNRGVCNSQEIPIHMKLIYQEVTCV